MNPKFLLPGDKVSIISTARKISQSELIPAIQILNEWGLNVTVGRNLFQEENQFAGTDQQRLVDLQSALDDSEVRAIFCARGGYGTPRIIDQVNWDKFIGHPKWVVGFSDVTVMLNQISNLGISSLHAPMPLFFNKDDYKASIQALRKFLFGDFRSIETIHHHLNRSGDAKGILVGGNLSLIINSLSTQTEFDPTGKILLLEDIDEYLYHIDRMMLHLKRAGILSRISGLIIGHFTDMKDNMVPFGQNAYEIIYTHVKELDCPLVFNFPSGHAPENMPLPIGNLIKLQVRNEGVKVDFS